MKTLDAGRTSESIMRAAKPISSKVYVVANVPNPLDSGHMQSFQCVIAEVFYDENAECVIIRSESIGRVQT